MTENNNIQVDLNIDEIRDLKKQYKKIKKYMRSGLYHVKVMDGTEKIVSSLLNDSETVS